LDFQVVHLGFFIAFLVFPGLSWFSTLISFHSRIYRHMKHILAFPLFESVSLTPDQKVFLEMCMENTNLNSKFVQDPATGKVTTLGKFDAQYYYESRPNSDKQKIRDLFNSIPFGVAEGNFSVRGMYLDAMVNFPSSVEGTLSLSRNSLLTLEGIPKMIYKDLSLEDNHLISLEGMEETEVRGTIWFADNWIRGLWLREDLTRAKAIGTWVPIYLDILSGETSFSGIPNPNEQEEAKAFIMEKKTTKAQMEEAIRVAPAEMTVALSRKRTMPQEMQDLLPTLNVPEGFWDAPDLMGDLEGVGL
jgi:hypothetical protein